VNRTINNELHIVVEEGGSEGNNPVVIKDDDGYRMMLWSNWARKLGLVQKGMIGRLVFIPDDPSHIQCSEKEEEGQC